MRLQIPKATIVHPIAPPKRTSAAKIEDIKTDAKVVTPELNLPAQLRSSNDFFIQAVPKKLRNSLPHVNTPLQLHEALIESAQNLNKQKPVDDSLAIFSGWAISATMISRSLFLDHSMGWALVAAVMGGYTCYKLIDLYFYSGAKLTYEVERAPKAAQYAMLQDAWTHVESSAALFLENPTIQQKKPAYPASTPTLSTAENKRLLPQKIRDLIVARQTLLQHGDVLKKLIDTWQTNTNASSKAFITGLQQSYEKLQYALLQNQALMELLLNGGIVSEHDNTPPPLHNLISLIDSEVLAAQSMQAVTTTNTLITEATQRAHDAFEWIIETATSDGKLQETARQLLPQALAEQELRELLAPGMLESALEKTRMTLEQIPARLEIAAVEGKI